MKKTLLLILALTMAVVFCSCSDAAKENENSTIFSTSNNDNQIPASNTTLSDENGDANVYKNLGIYDEIFIEALPLSQGAIETYEEIMADEEYNKNIDSLYRIKIVRLISKEEAQNLNGWSEMWGDQNCTFYEGIIEYDYFDECQIDETIIFRMPGTIQGQRINEPPFSSDDVIAVVTLKKVDGEDITRLFKSYAFIYDIVTINDVEHALVRGQGVKEIENDLTNYQSESFSRITTTTLNPVLYQREINMNEVAGRLSDLWEDIIEG